MVRHDPNQALADNQNPCSNTFLNDQADWYALYNPPIDFATPPSSTAAAVQAPLHRLREWGCPNKIFDLLDEASLSHAQMRDCVGVILGAAELPHPQIDYAGFEAELTAALGRTPPVFDPLRRRHEPWVQVSRVRKRFSGAKSSVCTVS